MMFDSVAVGVAIAGLAINILATVATVAWKMSRVELSMKLALREAMEESTKEIDGRIDMHVRYFGETVAAVRQKIVEVELFARDTFLRKDESHQAIEQLGDRIEAQLTRLERRLDK